ncbi:hypothetical protein K466DRAFT_607969 [Polyporus arcularius HHB13444]|uniref:Uncharacterized protein n=1 Tax=Polyporus arcularius HHB13444 TaxID=1314778 RepID=A0A5C3NVN9_9APHY|nr:hypothetical protein K466DRAFT_607969 [Polyporus arcularius HHB13444]
MAASSTQSQGESATQFLAREGGNLFSWASDFDGMPEFTSSPQSLVCARLAEKSFRLVQVALHVAWGLGHHIEAQDDNTTDFLMIRHELATAFRAVDAVIPGDAHPFLSTPAAALHVGCSAPQSDHNGLCRAL